MGIRKRKGQKVHGWVILDKPSGVTSTQAVSRVRRLFDAQKAGHAGTLDPLATGVLAIALGEATKTVPFAMDAKKRYRFTVRFGEARDTDDCEGQVIATSEVRPTEAAIRAALPRFEGDILQVPPRYSAVKVAGERAYDLARDGEEVDLAPRAIRIDRLDLLDLPSPGEAIFEMDCGKGAYVRSFARDLAEALGTVGHVAHLRRLAIGGFSEKDAISLDKLEALGHSPAALEHLRPIATALDDIPALAVAGPDAVRIRSGNPILLRAGDYQKLAATRAASAQDGDGLSGPDIQGVRVFLSTQQGEPVALAEVAQGELRPFRVFNFGP